jgi:hypothetical protein
MDILSGRREGAGIKGEVRLNGNLMSAKAMRQTAGYVQQEDVLPGTATVWEYLWFIASLRLPPKLSEAQREHRVASLIKKLRLEKAIALTYYHFNAILRSLPASCLPSYFSLYSLQGAFSFIILCPPLFFSLFSSSCKVIHPPPLPRSLRLTIPLP